jgi:hypothetical protein
MRFHLNFLACALRVLGFLLMAAEMPQSSRSWKKSLQQDRAQEMRRNSFTGKSLIRFTRGNGRLAREELRELR